MATISDMRAEIEEDILKRTDMTVAINRAIRDAHRYICGKVPFDELQTGPFTIDCVADQQSYNLATLLSAGAQPALAGIVSIKMEYSSTQVIRLKRSHVRLYDAMRVPPSGKPVKYARWGAKIEIWPPPDSSTYDMELRYWSVPTESGTLASTTLVPPPVWEPLIKWEAMYLLYTILNRPMDALSLIAPSQIPNYPGPKKRDMTELGIIPRLWNDLLQTISQRENVDEDFSINPVARRYTHA
jgi:hypothetical protein